MQETEPIIHPSILNYNNNKKRDGESTKPFFPGGRVISQALETN